MSGDADAARALRAERLSATLGGTRDTAGAARVFGTVALLAAIFAIPAAHRAVGVTFVQIESFLVLSALVALPATIIYRRGGVTSRAYDACIAAEAAVYIGGSLLLVYVSGSVVSAFWLWYAGYLLVNTPVDFRRIHAPIGIGAPLLLCSAYVARGDARSAVIAALISVTTILVYQIMSTSRAKLEESEIKRMLLERRLERESIGRDLHDGLGAELTVLLWKARELGADDLAASTSAAIDELREIVAGMHAMPTRWPELVAYVRARVARVCAGRVELVVEAGDTGPVIDPKMASHVVRTAMEAVRNAVQHGAPRKVTVRLLPDAIEIEDDGRGISDDGAAGEGLANLRERARSLGGELEVRTTARGTWIRLGLTAVRR